MFLGWITGMHPPGKTLAVFSAGKVVMHKLQVCVGCGSGCLRAICTLPEWCLPDS